MYVYLIHFERPISPNHTTQHYVGCCTDLDQRIEQHRAGRGARLLEVAKERNINWRVIRVWRAGWAFERWLKRQKEHRVFCPVCSPNPRQTDPESVPVRDLLNRRKTA